MGLHGLLKGKFFFYFNFRVGIRPPLSSSGQSSWLQSQRSGLDSQSYHISWEVLGLERGPLNLVSTTEDQFGRKSSDSGLESQEYCLGIRWR
jgi:hypothetical protein